MGAQRLPLVARLQSDSGESSFNRMLELRKTFPTDGGKEPDMDRHRPVPSQMMALGKGSQRQQVGVTGNLTAGKIGADELMT